MKKRLPAIGAAILLFCVLAACIGTRMSQISLNSITGSGKVIEESRSVNGLHAVNLATIGNMTIRLGTKEGLSIEAEDNILPLIITQVENGELVVQNQPNINLIPTKPIKYFLTVKQLDALQASSLGNISAPDLEADTFKITITSGGNITTGAIKSPTVEFRLNSMGSLEIARLQTTMLTASLHGAGNIHIAGGEVKDQDIELTSMGSYEASNLDSYKAEPEPMTGQVTVHSSGAGNVELGEVNTGTLEVSTQSMGSVHLVKLTAAKVNAEVTGAGNITIDSGRVRDQFIHLTSMGSYQAESMESARVEATISGAGSAYVRASEHIQANLTSLGNLEYSGQPQVEENSSSLGQVKQNHP